MSFVRAALAGPEIRDLSCCSFRALSCLPSAIWPQPKLVFETDSFSMTKHGL